MTFLQKLVCRKKAELWVRLSIAAESLVPDGEMHWLDRAIYRRLGLALKQQFLKFAAQELALERRRMEEGQCKHDKAGDAAFCPDCGKQLSTDPDVEASLTRVVKKVLGEYGITPKAKPKGDGKPAGEAKSLKEKLGFK